MSPACNGIVANKTRVAHLEHLNKRTRVELLAAENDHNYTQLYGGPTAPIKIANERLANNAANNNGRMDDCTAAMVLMFLSSRPGEEKQKQDQVASQHQQQQSKAKHSDIDCPNGRQSVPADGASGG